MGAPVSNDMAALPTSFAASMVAVCSAATGGLRGSKQDAMKEVSGTANHYPKDWHKWLPGNNGLYDETPSGEQDAMKEVSGTARTSNASPQGLITFWCRPHHGR